VDCAREHRTKKPTGERRFLCIGCRAGLSGLVQPATCWIGDPNVDEDRAAELTGGVRRAPHPGKRDAVDRAARSHDGNPSLDRVSRAYSYSGQPALTRSGRLRLSGLTPIVSPTAPPATPTVAHTSPVLGVPRGTRVEPSLPTLEGYLAAHPAAGGARGGLAIAARETRTPRASLSRAASSSSGARRPLDRVSPRAQSGLSLLTSPTIR